MTRRPASPAADDPDATARLPVLDATLDAAPADPMGSTDVLPVPAVPAATVELAERLREVEQQLQRDALRVRDLEAQLEGSAGRVADLEAELERSRARQAQLEAELREQRAQVPPQVLPQAPSMPEVRAPAGDVDDRDAAELRRRCDRQLEALNSWEGFRAVTDSLLAEAESRDAVLKSQLEDLSRSLQDMRQRARSTVDASGTSELEALRSEVAALQAELAAAREREQQAEQRAQAEAARVRDLESEIQAAVMVMGDRRAGAEVLHAPVAPVGTAWPSRLLVRKDGSDEVVREIGRRTTIGRTPDNDIQIDAQNVSRHHAVLLASADQCLVEDLNSTNGVLVNGKRVARQPLAHGDRLVIGKTEFIFLQRP